MESERVLVCVSGGGDSVGLLRGLHAASELSLTLTVAHFNHGWREKESDDDADWVKSLSEKLGLGFVSGHGDPADAGSEEVARKVRYGFFETVARQHGCGLIAVAHTADDQAETVLHHILRGTGLAGLRGIPAKRALGEGLTLVRPLLECSRGVLEEWLTELQQEWRTDASNSDVRFTRNRIRHELLPHLEEQFNPQVGKALASLARQADETHAFIRGLAEKTLNEVLVNRSEALVRLDADRLSDVSGVILREVLVRIWQMQEWPLSGMTSTHWRELADAAVSGRAMTLPGRIDARRRGTLYCLCSSQ